MVLIVGSNSDDRLKKIENYLNEIDDITLEILKYIVEKQKRNPGVTEDCIYEFFEHREIVQKTLKDATAVGLLQTRKPHAYQVRTDLSENVWAISYRERGPPHRIGE